MQINHYAQKYKRLGGWIAKSLVSGLAVFFILEALRGYELTTYFDYLDDRLFWVVLIVFGLMGINWSLEAIRWQLSVPQEQLDYQSAMHAVFSGLAMNWVLPFAFGDLGARLMSIRHKKKSMWALLLNRSFMLVISASYGGVAMLYYFDYLYWWSVLVWILLVLLAFTIGGKSLGKTFLDKKNYSRVLHLSLLRYAVFTLQFLILIHHFLPEIPVFVHLMAIGWIYFFRSFLPGVFGNLGVREASAVVFYESLLPDPAIILLPCLMIWVINSIVPSLIGTFMVYKLPVKIAQ